MTRAPAFRSVGVGAAILLCTARSLAAAPPTTAPAQRSLAAPTPVVGRVLPPAAAHRHIVIDGQEIHYVVTWFENELRDSAGAPAATISATSYVRDNLPRRASRPVVVFFNGGPGASSSPLHFAAFGPRRRAAAQAVDRASPAGPINLTDNAASPIDVADLLFIDPVGTGFSRELREGGGRAYWNPSADAAAMLSLVRRWMRDNGRLESPLIVVGQSYGGLRAALMAADMHDLNVAALVLVSPATNPTGNAGAASNDLPFVFSLPTMAVAAAHHGKVITDHPDAASVWESARAFAQGDYLLALHRGDRLPPAERRRIAERVSSVIGLPPEMVEAANLRVDTQSFLENLLGADGKLLGRLDSRVVAPKPVTPVNPDRPAAANDPSLGLGRSNVIRSAVAAQYFRDEVGLRTERDYFGVTLDVNFNWDWRDSMPAAGAFARLWFDATPNLARLLAAKPNARLLVVGGYHDLATPWLGVHHAMNHAGLPPHRHELLALPGGHSPYEDEDNLRIMAAKLRELAVAPAR